MKIAIPYFEQELSTDRKHHEVNLTILEGWQRFYENSGTTMKPVLLLDRNTKPPSLWKYESIVVSDDSPPKQQDVLNKVGWIKHQAYDLIGPCVIMDLDALICKNVDSLQRIPSPMAMAPDGGTMRNWNWVKKWPQAKYKFNAGVIVVNAEIRSRFRELWEEMIDLINYTFYDEIIFSRIFNELNGYILPTDYNCSFGQDNNDVMIVHFSGKRKEDIIGYLQ